MVKYSCLGVGTKFRVIYDGCFDYGKMDTHVLGVGTKFRVIYDGCFDYGKMELIVRRRNQVKSNL